MRKTKTTFAGPVSSETSVSGGSRVTSIYFLLMTAGGDFIKLEYETRRAAHTARKQLLKSPLTEAVPSTRLLQAIHATLQEAGQSTPKARAYADTLQAIVDMEASWEAEQSEDVNDDLWKQGYSEAIGEAAAKAKITLAKWNHPDR